MAATALLLTPFALVSQSAAGPTAPHDAGAYDAADAHAAEPRVGDCRAGCEERDHAFRISVVGPSAKPQPEAGPPPPIASNVPVVPIVETRIRHDAVVTLANERGAVCTGTLVAPTLVLSARHCLPLREARFGAEPLSPTRTTPIVRSYVPPLTAVDAALLELAEQGPVAPMPLRNAPDREAPKGFVRLAGFGATDTEGRRGMSRLHFVDVPTRGWNCDREAEARTGCQPDFEMVIPRDRGNDTCAGDSGGPVLESFGAGLRVVAVTSRSVNGALLRCGDGGIYTRVDVVGEWIESVRRKVAAKR